MQVGDLVAKLTLDAKSFMSGMTSVKSSVKKNTEAMDSSSGSLLGYKSKIVAIAIAAYGVGKALTGMIREVQSLRRTMIVAADGAENAAQSWNFLRNISKKLGLDLGMLAKNYIDFNSAALGSGLTQKQLQKIFEGTAQKAAVMSLSTDATARTFKALSDMASSAFINMQDLKLQLSGAMPGAMGIMARALGVTVAEMKAMVKTGNMAAKDVLPLLGEQMRKESEEGVKMLGMGLRSSVAGLSSAFFELKDMLADSILADALSLIIATMAVGIKVVTTFGKAINFVTNTMGAFITWAKGVYDPETMNMLGTMGIDLGNLQTTAKVVKEVSDEVIETFQEQKDNIEEVFGGQGKALEAWRKEVAGAFEGTLHDITSFVSSLATGADVSFTEMLSNMAKRIMDFGMEMLVVKPILEWFKKWLEDVTKPGGGGAGGGIGGIFASIIGSLGGVKAMAGGGIINEPVLGIGAKSKSGYLIGEAGPEAVVPAGLAGGGGGGSTVNVTITALDSKSVTELLRDNPGAVTGPIVEAITSGDRGLSASLRTAVS